jgi:hypothetical protein
LDVVYCDNCRCQIAADAVSGGAAVRGGNGKLYCAKCASLIAAETKTGDYTPVKSPAKFYFCETCGKRVTDVDIERGGGRDKKLKGIYCKACAVGVMTIEFDAIQEAPAGKPTPAHLQSERPPPSSSAKKASAFGLTPAHRSAGHPENKPSGRVQAHGAKPERGRQAAPTPVILGAVGVAVLLVVFLVMGSSQESTPRKPSVSTNTADPIQSPTPTPTPSREVTPVDSRTTPAAAENNTSRPLPETPRVEQPAPSVQGTDTEALAAQAFDKLMKSEGEQEDKAARVAAIEQFLKTYGDTIVAARARLLLAEMTNTAPQTAHVQSTDSPQATPSSQPPQSSKPQNTPGEFKAIVDPKTLVGIEKNALNAWRSTGDAIENIPKINNAAKTTGAYGDGEYHIRFSTENANSLFFKVRFRGSAGNEIRFDGATPKTLQGKVHDLNIICQGAQTSAKLDGNEVLVTGKASPGDGCMMFNTSGGKLKIYCMEWRKLER